MRVERALVGLFWITAFAVAGCGGQLAYNLPPASRLMEPGPGVGGPGPGVIPPAGSPYGIYGGAVGRYGGVPGAPGTMIGGGYGGVCANQPGPMSPANSMVANGNNSSANNSGVVQAGYYADCGCDDGGCYGGPCGPCACGGAGCGLCRGGALHGLRGLFHKHRHYGHEARADGAMWAPATSQVAFLGAEGVQVSWDVSGSGFFDSTPLVIPGRQDFYQGAIYRLKLTNLPGRPGVELYPTLEIAPVTPRTDAYLAHAPIPVQFTEEDFDQVLSGNFVTKVIYLPDPEFQELALAGVETLVSTRLDPGVDPIAEADRRGSILAILRMGNKDLEGGSGVEYENEGVMPAAFATQASYREPAPFDGESNNGGSSTDEAYADHAIYHHDANAAGGVVPAQCYDDGGYGGDCYGGGNSYDGGYDGEYGGYAGGGYFGAGMDGNMPMGMPTSGFAPPAMPPNYIAGAPQWGMPITGTPIGLPGPPHVPLGVPASLQKHVIKNRTRFHMPPPVTEMKVSVKHRPGLNYPSPVDKVHVDEVQREPFRLWPAWIPHFFHHGQGGAGGPGGGGYGGGAYGPDCQ